ncbi:hypothetical protein ABFW11_13185 [Mycolicibacterium porcinum]|uniref:hypothetical protein n=1 Tax=Mycolicibacterium porcinum TaxID=39693 RepID=UPI0034CEB204
MDSDGTREALTGAGLAAQAGLAAGVPSLPVGAPTVVYTGAAAALLTKLEAEAGALVAFGLVTSAASVTTMETAEAENVGQLRT